LRHGCLCLCCLICRQRPSERLIPCPRSPAGCVKDQGTEKAAEFQQMAVEPRMVRRKMLTKQVMDLIDMHVVRFCTSYFYMMIRYLRKFVKHILP
jgi:hypothetical protein